MWQQSCILLWQEAAVCFHSEDLKRSGLLGRCISWAVWQQEVTLVSVLANSSNGLSPAVRPMHTHTMMHIDRYDYTRCRHTHAYFISMGHCSQ